MEEIQVNEETKVEETTEPEKVETNEKTFTQEEVNEIVKSRLAKAKKDMPSTEELNKFNEWKESQKTEEEKANETAEKINGLESNNKILKQEILLLKKGINEDDIDYIQFKLSKLEGDFKENLEKFLTENPKFVSKETKATGVQIKSNPVEQEDGVMSILKSRHQELN